MQAHLAAPGVAGAAGAATTRPPSTCFCGSPAGRPAVRRRPTRPSARFLGGPLAGGSFDDEDDVELTASAESALIDTPAIPGTPPHRGWLARAFRWRGGKRAPPPPPPPTALTVPVFDLADPTGARARALLAYVQGISPGEAVEAFTAGAPAEVVEAARAVSAGLVGTLPRSFTVSIAAADEDVGQLLYSALLTGYLMKNAAARLDLDRLASSATASTSSSASLLPGLVGEEEPPTTADALAAALASDAGAAAFAPGVQTDGVSGTVTKWHTEAGPVRVEASAYIAALEAQLEGARLKLAGVGAGWATGGVAGAAASSATATAAWPLAAALGGSPTTGSGGNALLGLLRTADAATLAGLTASASPGALEAANTFVGRLMGSGSSGGWSTAGGSSSSSSSGGAATHSAPDLAALVLLSLIVGWGLRSLEARFDLDQAMAA